MSIDLPCYIVGDSIAVGSAQSVKECLVDAKIGISSTAIVSRAHDARLVVISAGSNDPLNPHLKANLENIRKAATGRVLWIVPIHPKAASAVKEVAKAHGDGLITFSPARDNVHPRSYGPISRQIKAELISSLKPKAPPIPISLKVEPPVVKKTTILDWLRSH